MRLSALVLFALIVGVESVASAQTEPPKIIKSYREGEPIPPGYHLEERPRRWAIITGATMLASSYVTAIAYSDFATCQSGGSDCSRRWAVFVPVVGPFVDMAHSSLEDRAFTDLLVGSGEVAGAIFLIVGLTTTSTKLVPDPERAGCSVMPVVARAYTGFMLTLRL
jgi:hypothetical protein